jgi:hypothetical protein
MDLIDVESELRSHLAARGDRVASAPTDLVERTRRRHRQYRRHRAALVGVGLAVALLFGTVPVLRGVLPAVGRSDTAAPAASPLPSLYDLPVRGSLAGDRAWLTDVAALPWRENAAVDPDTVPPIDSHRVLYAADVAGTRVALVMGEEGALLSSAWFTGPAGANPHEMAQAAWSVRAYPDDPLMLLDDVGGPAVLVVVSRPGDEIEYTSGRTVSAAGDQADVDVALTAEDGVASASVPRPVGYPMSVSVRVVRDGQEVYSDFPSLSDRVADAAMAPMLISDPRGLRSNVEESWLQSLAQSALGSYGSGADGVTPVLLAAGPVAGTGDPHVAMVGLTFPSGATDHWAVRYEAVTGQSSSGNTTSTLPEPAGTPLLAQVVALRVGGALAVSAPASAATAVLLASDGTTVATVPLVDGGGATDLLPAPAPVAFRVRALDAAGTVLAEARVTGPA